MTTARVKNIVIILLCILAIYQIGGLWFENISGRSLFYTFFSSQNKTVVYGGEYNFTNPQNIVVGFGNKSFNKFFMNKQGKFLNDKVKDCMKYMAQEGKYLELKYINWDEILESKVVICYYAIDMPMDSYIKAMGNNSPQNFSSKQKTFNALAIVPARNTGEYLKTYFINTNDNSSSIFYYKKNTVSDNLYAAIEEIQKQPNNISYVSTYQSEFKMFDSNSFLPQNTKKDITYRPLKFYNPYKDAPREIVEKYIDNFFENPAARWSDEDKDGVYMFSDENIVVRYYSSSLFEYSNYSLNTNKSDSSFEAAFNVAVELIKRDENLPYESMYLAKAKKVDNAWQFGFDYYFDDFPIIMSYELKKDLGLEHMVEIEVENGIATNYKHYVCKFEFIPENRTVSVDFSTALNKVMANSQLNNANINDMYLSYVIDKNESDLDLKWILDIDNKKYAESTNASKY